MDRAGIELRVEERVRLAVEEAAYAAVGELNREGHDFARDPDGLLDWVDAGSGLRLEVFCALDVSLASAQEAPRPPDPDLERYLERAASGADRLAELLAGVEGEVANGGLMQLFDNRGSEFVHEAIAALREVGADATARLLGEAVAVMARHAATLDAYTALERDLGELDDRFEQLGEPLPSLYVRFRDSG